MPTFTSFLDLFGSSSELSIWRDSQFHFHRLRDIRMQLARESEFLCVYIVCLKACWNLIWKCNIQYIFNCHSLWKGNLCKLWIFPPTEAGHGMQKRFWREIKWKLWTYQWLFIFHVWLHISILHHFLWRTGRRYCLVTQYFSLEFSNFTIKNTVVKVLVLCFSIYFKTVLPLLYILRRIFVKIFVKETLDKE